MHLNVVKNNGDCKLCHSDRRILSKRDSLYKFFETHGDIYSGDHLNPDSVLRLYELIKHTGVHEDYQPNVPANFSHAAHETIDCKRCHDSGHKKNPQQICVECHI